MQKKNIYIYIYIYLLIYWTPAPPGLREQNTSGTPDLGGKVAGYLALVHTFLIFCIFFADRNFIKNQTPQKATQSHNKSANARFSIHFGRHFGIHFLSFFIFVAKVGSHVKHIKTNGISMISLFRKLTFCIKIR